MVSPGKLLWSLLSLTHEQDPILRIIVSLYLLFELIWVYGTVRRSEAGTCWVLVGNGGACLEGNLVF